MRPERKLGLLLYLKKPKNYVSGTVPIYFRITVDGIEREISARLHADPTKWSADANLLTGKSDAIKSVNDYLDILQTKAIQARTRLLALDKPITADSIKSLIMNKPLEAAHMVMDVFRDHNKKMRELVGKEYSEGTMESYDTAYCHTLSFVQDTYGVPDIDIQKLDYGLISDYEH